MNPKPLKHRKSLRGLEVSFDDLENRAGMYATKGYSPAKWMQFCAAMLDLKLRVFVYEAPSSYSKYVTVLNEHGRKFRVRFSNHPPSIHKENEGNCDFFVGINNLSTATTGQAVEAAIRFFKPQPMTMIWIDEAASVNEMMLDAITQKKHQIHRAFMLSPELLNGGGEE